MDEQEAIRHCQGGDKESFRFLVETHQQKALRIACLILGDPEKAEEVTQDAFLAAWQGIHTFKLGHPLAPWLFKIVVRCAMKRLRKKSIQVTLVKRIDDVYAPDPAPAPDLALQGGEQIQAVRAAIGRLTPQRKLIITLHYYAELTIGEISEALEIPEGTIKSEIHRAKQDMRPMLREVLGNEMERTS